MCLGSYMQMYLVGRSGREDGMCPCPCVEGSFALACMMKIAVMEHINYILKVYGHGPRVYARAMIPQSPFKLAHGD